MTHDRNGPEQDEGFTLIELLVVVIIIGILAAIAIPTFLSQREKAWRTSVKADLHNAAIVAETYYDGNLTYAGLVPAEFKMSDDVSIVVASATPQRYCLNADHLKLQGGVDFHLDSDVGRPEPGGC